MITVGISVANLHKSFRAPSGEKLSVLQSINMEAEPRSLTCILGPSGCGKTTLLRLVAGLEKPDSGTIRVFGEEVEGPCRDRGLIFQEYALFPWRTVLRNVEFGLEVRGVGRSSRRKTARHYIDMVGLRGFEDYHPHQLSGGMKQRVAVARALANDPDVILMDEPFGSLDSQTRISMQKHLLDLHRLTQKTILLVTHSVEEAVTLGHRVIIMSRSPGRIAGVLPGARSADPGRQDRLKNRVMEILEGCLSSPSADKAAG